DQRLATPAAQVREVLPAVELAPLYGAPPAVLGLLNLRGRPIPVFDVRRRLNMPPRPLQASEHLVVVETKTRLVALRVDQALKLTTAAMDDRSAMSVDGGVVAGAAAGEDGMVLVYDLDAFLSPAESRGLDAALAKIDGLEGANP
ncbi:MAG: chemotaxis protein CheW, partial [Planctomycetia bacterium]